MSDDTLRMRAVVDDGFTAPLADLRKKLRGVGSNSTARAVQKDWKGVGKEITGVANTLRLGVAGAFRVVGLSSLAAGIGVAGVGVALTGAVLGVRKLAGEVRGMRIFSSQVGLTVQQLRVLKVVTDRFGMSWDGAQGSLKTFSNNLFELQRHWGEAYNQLRGMNLAGLAEDLAKAPDMQTALNRALEGIKNIKNPVLQRRVAEILLGTDQWATIARESYGKLQKEIAATLKELPKGSQEAADKFANDMGRIGVELENLRTQFLAPLLPPFERLIKLMAGAGNFGSGIVGKAGSFLGSILGAAVTGLERLSQGKLFTGHIKEREIGAKIARDEKALESVKSLIEDARKRGESVAPELQRKQDELIKQIEHLRKAIEKTNQQGALLQNQSVTGIGAGGGGGVIAASYGGGLGFGGGYARPSGGGISRPMGRASGNAEVPAGSGPSAGGLGGSKREVARIVADEWRRAGMSEKGIAGLMANIAEESSFNPTLRHADQPRWSGEAHYAHGLYQEGGAEWNRYAAWLAKNHPGADWRDPRLQSRFAAENLKANYPRVWAGMNHANDPTSAGSLYASGYLKPRADYLRSRIAKFRRGLPGVEHYTGRMPVAQSGMPPAGRSLDLLSAARRADAMSMKHMVEGNASLKIDFNGLPEGSRVRSSTSGLFRNVQISRGRPMQSVWDSGQ